MKRRVSEAWTDGMTDEPYYWAIIIPPVDANTDPRRRPCSIVAGTDAAQALTEAHAQKNLWANWDGVTQCQPTTRPLTELEVRNALRKRGLIVSTVIRIGSLHRKDRTPSPFRYAPMGA